MSSVYSGAGSEVTTRRLSFRSALIIGQIALSIVLLIFASVALVLASIGIYGLISYSTAQRIPEFGIRRSLGAPQASIWQIVVTQSLRLALCGVIIGIMVAMMLTRFVTSYLFHIRPTDPALRRDSSQVVHVALSSLLQICGPVH